MRTLPEERCHLAESLDPSGGGGSGPAKAWLRKMEAPEQAWRGPATVLDASPAGQVGKEPWDTPFSRLLGWMRYFPLAKEPLGGAGRKRGTRHRPGGCLLRFAHLVCRRCWASWVVCPAGPTQAVTHGASGLWGQSWRLELRGLNTGSNWRPEMLLATSRSLLWGFGIFTP